MADMNVEEAVKQMESLLSEGDYAMKWGDTIDFNEKDGKAIRVVLDELKALQECENCRCDGEDKKHKLRF